MNYKDWMAKDVFQKKVIDLRKSGVEFISLTEAYRHICVDRIRTKKYAVLTFDDGYSSLKEILPWLEEQHIPVTLFINSKYLDGKSFRNNSNERYITKDELFELDHSLIEIGSHWWEHVNTDKLSDEEFEKGERININLLSNHSRFVPFHAYTYGHYRHSLNNILADLNMVPVYIDGMRNYNERYCVHRELLRI